MPVPVMMKPAIISACPPRIGARVLIYTQRGFPGAFMKAILMSPRWGFFSTNHHITTSPHHHITTSPHHHITRGEPPGAMPLAILMSYY